MRRIGPGRALAGALSVVAVALAGAVANAVLTEPALMDEAPEHFVTRAGPPALPRPTEPMTMPDVVSFAAIVERPLFAETRRPPKRRPVTVAKAEAPPPPPPQQIPTGQFKLGGVTVAEQQTYALVKHVEGDEFIRVVKGQVVEKWKVEEITPEKVVISQRSVRDVIYLRDNEAPRSASRMAKASNRSGRPRSMADARAAARDARRRALAEQRAGGRNLRFRTDSAVRRPAWTNGTLMQPNTERTGGAGDGHGVPAWKRTR